MFHLLPRARRRHWRARFRANRVRRRKGRAIAVASGIDQNAAAPISLTKLLRQPRRVAAHQYLTNLVRERFDFPKLRFAIQWYGYMKAFGS
jgi:hypothetical protein